LGRDAPNFEARQVTHYTGDDGMPIAALKLTPDVEPSSMRAAASRMTRRNRRPTSNVEKRTQQVWAADVDQGGRQSGEPRLLGDMAATRRIARTSRFLPREFAVWAAKKQIWIAPISGTDEERDKNKKKEKGEDKDKNKAKALFFARGNNSQPKWCPMGRRSLSAAVAAITASWSFTNLDGTRCAMCRRAPTAICIRAGRRRKSVGFRADGGQADEGAADSAAASTWAIWVYDVASDAGTRFGRAARDWMIRCPS